MGTQTKSLRVLVVFHVETEPSLAYGCLKELKNHSSVVQVKHAHLENQAVLCLGLASADVIWSISTMFSSSWMILGIFFFNVIYSSVTISVIQPVFIKDLCFLIQ